MKTEKEIEQLAETQCFTMESKIGFAWGYEQCQEDMADKMNNVMETLLKIRDCKDYGNNSSSLARELIHSLNNKQD